MTKPRDPRNDIAFKKIFSEDNIEKIKDFAESIQLYWGTPKTCVCGTGNFLKNQVIEK